MSLGQQTVELVRQPDAYYYVARKEPANITCEVYGAQSVVFSCAGTQIPASSQRNYENYDEVRGQNFIRSTIQVTRSDIVNQDNEDFGCECRAMVDDSTVGATSTRGIISLSCECFHIHLHVLTLIVCYCFSLLLSILYTTAWCICVLYFRYGKIWFVCSVQSLK